MKKKRLWRRFHYDRIFSNTKWSGSAGVSEWRRLQREEARRKPPLVSDHWHVTSGLTPISGPSSSLEGKEGAGKGNLGKRRLGGGGEEGEETRRGLRHDWGWGKEVVLVVQLSGLCAWSFLWSDEVI
eukprot:2300731-Rhodomonas_salina.2